MMDSVQYPVPEPLYAAVQTQESLNDPDAVSPAGAVGLMQTMPETLRDPGYGVKPAQNDTKEERVRVGRDYLQAMHDKYNGDTDLALMAYNWGPHNLDKVLAGDLPETAIPKETANYPGNVYKRLAPEVQTTSNSKEVTDPDILAQLNAGTQAPAGQEVTDPDILAQLNGGQYTADPTRAAYQATMNTVARPINNAINSVVTPVMGGVASAGAVPAQVVANAIDYTGAGQWIGDNLLETKNAVSNIGGRMASNLKDLESYNPDLEKDLSAFGDNAKLLGNLTAVKGAGKAIASATQPAADSFAASKAANLAAKPIPYDDLTTHSAISNSYGAAKEAVKPYYNLMQDIGAGETAKAGDLKPALDSMIADIQNTPFHEATSELAYLKQQAAKIGEGGTMPLNDMVKLKQNLNSNFNPKRFMQGADTPYAKVGGIIDDSLADASKRIPEFAEAKSLADKQWLNTVKSPFEDNRVLQQFWKPEDYYAKRSVENGMLEELPDPTKQRAGKMFSKIATPVDLNAVRRVLPDDMANSLSQAKIADIKAGKSKIGQVGQAAWNAGNMQFSSAGKNILNAVKTQFSPEEQALMRAAKASPPALSTRYAKPFQQLKAQVQQMRDSAGEMRPVDYPKYPTSNFSPVDVQKALPAPANPKPLLALPAPNTLVASPRQPFRAMTSEEMVRAADPENARGLTAEDTQPFAARNDPRAPTNSPLKAQYQEFKVAQSDWDKASAELSAQGLTFKQIANKIGARPESFKDGGAVKKFAKGGSVSVNKAASSANKNPTAAQKESGNYKKGHINLHGLPITIENPRGSTRSGKDKSGKAWKVTMPDHYGYIKNTDGMDGEHVDAYVGPNPHSKQAFIIDQIHADTGKPDEHKVMLGYDDAHHAIGQYQKAFSDGKGIHRIGAVSAIGIGGLKKWLKTNATKKPAVKMAIGGSVQPAKNYTAQFLAAASHKPLKIGTIA